MTWLAEVPAAPAPLFVPALAGLFIIAACFFAIGACKLIDAVMSMLYEFIRHTVGRIPILGRIVVAKSHQLEQIISHYLGAAEHRLDGYVAWTWHNMARMVTLIGHEIEGLAVESWNLAQRMKHFVRRGEVTQQIAHATRPLRAHDKALDRDVARGRAGTKAAGAQAAHAAHGAHVAQAQAATVGVRWWRLRITRRVAGMEAALAALGHYVRGRGRVLTTGAFIGAAAWALTKLGAGWIRCNNWRRIGRKVCGLPTDLISDLLSLSLAAELVIDPEAVAEVALSVTDEFEAFIERIAE